MINTDLSTVVIHQQRNRFPDLKWKVLDALDMSEIPESSIPIVIDKSLIDVATGGVLLSYEFQIENNFE